MKWKKKKRQPLDENTVRVIKISKEALFELLYEHFIGEQERYLDVDMLSVTNAFDLDWESGEFVFCAYNSEDADGNRSEFCKEIDLRQIMKQIPDTTPSVLLVDPKPKYREYTKDELRELSHE